MFSSILLGIAIGSVITGAYYDGFVSDEYRRHLESASRSHNYQSTLLNEKEDEVRLLKAYARELLKELKQERSKIKTI